MTFLKKIQNHFLSISLDTKETAGFLKITTSALFLGTFLRKITLSFYFYVGSLYLLGFWNILKIAINTENFIQSKHNDE